MVLDDENFLNILIIYINNLIYFYFKIILYFLIDKKWYNIKYKYINNNILFI